MGIHGVVVHEFRGGDAAIDTVGIIVPVDALQFRIPGGAGRQPAAQRQGGGPLKKVRQCGPVVGVLVVIGGTGAACCGIIIISMRLRCLLPGMMGVRVVLEGSGKLEPKAGALALLFSFLRMMESYCIAAAWFLVFQCCG